MILCIDRRAIYGGEMAHIEHSRIPATFDVPADQVEIDPASRTDPRIVQTYAALNRGEIKMGLTRMPTASIISGFFLRDTFGAIEHVSNFDADMVPYEAKRIRCGFRDPLDLHWSPHAPDGGGYICPDDEIKLGAYRQLNIEFVPCRIIRPKPTPNTEAAIWIEKRGQYIGMARSVPPVMKTYQSIIGDEFSDLAGALTRLMRLCSLSRASIKAFHEEPTRIAPIHYHQTLHAVVARHERALDSVLNLIQVGRREHALAIVRMAYEAFLNFYLDWLSPQFFGLRMQALAAN